MDTQISPPTIDEALAASMTDTTRTAQDRLEEWLRVKGLNQEAGAERLGITRPTLRAALGESPKLAAPSIRKISKATGIPAGDLL